MRPSQAARAAWRGLSRLPQRGLLLLVHTYRLLFKAWVGNVCPYEPTCSAYALQALQRHGAAGGTLLAGWRLLRCHPWCEGGCDPVPDVVPNPLRGLFTRPGAHGPDSDTRTRHLP